MPSTSVYSSSNLCRKKEMIQRTDTKDISFIQRMESYFCIKLCYENVPWSTCGISQTVANWRRWNVWPHGHTDMECFIISVTAYALSNCWVLFYWREGRGSSRVTNVPHWYNDLQFFKELLRMPYFIGNASWDDGNANEVSLPNYLTQ